MAVLFFILSLVQNLFLFVLSLTGKKLLAHLQAERQALAEDTNVVWPTVALIVPVAGKHPNMPKALRSLLEQDYPSYTPIFVTESEHEDAAELIRKLQTTFPQLQHSVAGRAVSCCQKNHNLLAGVAWAEQLNVDCYVFCDSTHLAKPDFLRCLVYPLARGQASFATGYHSVEPEDTQVFTLAYSLQVLLMRLLQAIPPFTQPWGGAMAMRKQFFLDHGIKELWSCSIVDDCALVPLLQKSGERVRLCASALLQTSARAHSLAVWKEWLTRQILFPKFCVPEQWLGLGLLLPIMGWSVALLIWLFVTLWTGGLNTFDGVFLLLTGSSCLLAYRQIASLRLFLTQKLKISAGKWFLAFCVALNMFLFVYCSNLFTMHLTWHNKCYRVGKGGRIIERTP